MRPPGGVYAHRNAGHKTAHAKAMAEAVTSTGQLTAAYDWFRASARLLARRRQPPRGVSQDTHRAAADQLLTQAAQFLADLARRADRCEFDAPGKDGTQ